MIWRLILIMNLLATPVLAIQPDEILDDPVLEERAREMSKILRCLVCRNENIDDSNAGLARDLRILVRERIVAGDSNEETLDFVVDRYGEFVLLQPLTGGSNWVLWASGPLMLLFGLGGALVYLRGRAKAPEMAVGTFSEAEAKRLREIMDE